MRTPQLLIAVLVALSLATSASAQHRINQKPRSPERVLMDRDREALHPEPNPLDLRALDQSEEGFRSGTPALLRADVSVARVDAGELRKRRLAMYEKGAHFDTPVAAPVASSASNEEQPVQPTPAAPDEPRDDDSGGPAKKAWILCFGVAGGLAAFIVIRRR